MFTSALVALLAASCCGVISADFDDAAANKGDSACSNGEETLDIAPNVQLVLLQTSMEVSKALPMGDKKIGVVLKSDVVLKTDVVLRSDVDALSLSSTPSQSTPWLGILGCVLICSAVSMYHLYFMLELDDQESSKEVLAGENVTGGAALLISVIQQEPPKDQKRNTLTALDFARLLAILHIVWGHFGNYYTVEFDGETGQPSPLLPRDAYPLFNALAYPEWMKSWIPFFFMLSGFVATYSKLMKEEHLKEDSLFDLLPQPRTILRRLASIYPTYLAALGLSAGAAVAHVGISVAIHPTSLIQEALLLQTELFADCVMQSYNIPGWFVSALAGFWILEQPLFTIAAAGVRHLGLFLAILCVVVFSLCWPLARCPFTYASDKHRDLQQSCLSYLHQYFLGILLAFLFHWRAGSTDTVVRISRRYLASFATAALFIMFFMDPRHLGGDVFFIDRNFREFGIAMPLQAMFILGLAEGEDPIARLFTKLQAVSICGLTIRAADISLGVYLLHFSVFSIFVPPHTTPVLWYRVLTGMLCSICTAVSVHFVIQRPFTKFVGPWLSS